MRLIPIIQEIKLLFLCSVPVLSPQPNKFKVPEKINAIPNIIRHAKPIQCSNILIT